MDDGGSGSRCNLRCLSRLSSLSASFFVSWCFNTSSSFFCQEKDMGRISRLTTHLLHLTIYSQSESGQRDRQAGQRKEAKQEKPQPPESNL